ncbi:type I-C CRISPR-associated protein Cas8c/Csd1 [Heliobacterium undosum]|uniref:Type I-C CRISPR-associated protein Cas8c/Csd1 n=1 Tax=Heliomicrobium undosum TaxID=121734 RepID=A0A845L512_9FIRM|nr:type I-C CRISPR-associated protein Cas8c/Csd1 [Heliomicrobium undosum]MZP30796.1 type I-C CRISPR-associated protein Cas8c/Csd1 [Heliomicrobium undosum]
MILQALYDFYERMTADPGSGMPKTGYSKAKVFFALNLSASGDLLDLFPLYDVVKNKKVARELDVPEQIKRSSGISPNFLCDNSAYVLGIDEKGKPERALKAFEAFLQLHEEVFAGVDDEGAQAVLTFLRRRKPGVIDEPQWSDARNELLEGGNLVFRLDGSPGYIHDRPSVQHAWIGYTAKRESSEKGQCLVTGEWGPVARLHPAIKGVWGAQTAGASLVSFNKDSFESYGKEQSINSPVASHVASGYGAALNYLLGSKRNKVQIGDTATLFWAEREASVEESIIGTLIDPAELEDDEAPKDGRRYDPLAAEWVRQVLRDVRDGNHVLDQDARLDSSVRFYILGLSPNAARLSVRFWHVDTFGSLVERFVQHFRDMSIQLPVGGRWPEYPAIWRILKETAVQGERKNVLPQLGGTLARSILLGTAYPQALYQAILVRIRAEHEINPVRAGVIKAHLLRNARIYGSIKGEEALTMALNDQSTHPGYLLGRLFALLEKVQQEALPGINATIRDRYFGAASATPASVFPLLLRNAQHHLAKVEYSIYLEKKFQEIMAGLSEFPAHLNLNDQGFFMLGYYHQRQSFYTKKNDKEE